MLVRVRASARVRVRASARIRFRDRFGLGLASFGAPGKG